MAEVTEAGTRAWNRYDAKWGVVSESKPYSYNDGPLWYTVVHEDGSGSSELDYPQRMVPADDYRAGS